MREKVSLSLVIIASVLALILAGCERIAEETPTPVPVDTFASVVSVTGEVVPEKWAILSLQTEGRVIEAPVEPGDEIAPGDLLVRLDSTDAELAVQQAEAGLASAQAELARLKAQPRLEDIAAAEQGVEAAEASVSQAAAERGRVTSGAIESDIAAAQSRVAAAEAGRKEAQLNYDDVQAQRDDDKVDKWVKDEAAIRLRAAEQALEAAEISLSQAQKSADAQKREVNSVVWAATSQRDVAQARLELTRAGVLAEQIALAEIQVKQAQVELEAAQVQLERCELRAPFDGTISEVNVREGEQVSAGVPVVKLGDLSTLRVETTDLDEIDVGRVEIGQEADITFDALPDKVFTGHIVRISPMAEPEAGGVNYTVIIELEELAPEIRWGMTAFVDIETEQ